MMYQGSFDGNGDGRPRRAPATAPRNLHRLAAVRRLQGISRRSMARRLKTDVSSVKQQEHSQHDLLLSDLYRWQEALDVPLMELLLDSDELALPILRRAQLVRLMKTALAIQENSTDEPIRRMALTMIEQLHEIMPELKDISPWHTIGRRRRRDEFGVAADRRLSADVFMEFE